MAGVTSPICEQFLQVAGGSGQGRGYQDWPRGRPGAPFWSLAPLLYRKPEWLCRGAPACWGGDPSVVPRGSGSLDAPGWGHMAALLPLRAGPTGALYPTGRCEVPPSVLSFCVCVGAPVRNGVHCSNQGPRNASSHLLPNTNRLERVSVYWNSHSCTYYDCGH